MKTGHTHGFMHEQGLRKRNRERRDRNEQGTGEGARDERDRERRTEENRKSMSFGAIRRDENVSN